MNPFFDNIIVPVDFGEKTETIVKQAYRIAKLMNCDITLLHVVNKKKSLNYLESVDGNSYAEIDSELETKLRRLASVYANKFEIEIRYAVNQGEVSQQIVDFSTTNRARLIVLGRTGRVHQGDKYAIGNNTAQIIRQSRCPVISINEEIRKEFSTILLPLDLSKQIHHKINIAIQFSRFYGALVKVIAIINQENFSREPEFKSKLASIREFFIENNVASTGELIFNFDRTTSVASKIIEFANLKSADMIMIMTQQEKDWKHTFVGSTASQIIRESNLPVMSITPYQYEIG